MKAVPMHERKHITPALNTIPSSNRRQHGVSANELTQNREHLLSGVARARDWTRHEVRLGEGGTQRRVGGGRI